MGLTINSLEYAQKSPKMTFSFLATGTSETQAFSGWAKLHSYSINVPDWTNSINTIINIYTDAGDLIWTSGNLTDNATHTGTIDRVVDENASGGAYFEIALSGDSGNAADVELQIFFDLTPQRKIYR